jgi:hypothetical protein
LALSHWASSGLPDGLFSKQKSQFGYILECLGLENMDIIYICPSLIFYGLFGYSMTMYTFCIHLVHFFCFLVSCTKKNLATLGFQHPYYLTYNNNCPNQINNTPRVNFSTHYFGRKLFKINFHPKYWGNCPLLRGLVISACHLGEWSYVRVVRSNPDGV